MKKVISVILSFILVFFVAINSISIFAQTSQDKTQEITYKWNTGGGTQGYYNPNDRNNKQIHLKFLLIFKGYKDGQLTDNHKQLDTRALTIGSTTPARNEVRTDIMLDEDGKPYKDCEIYDVKLPLSDKNSIYSIETEKHGKNFTSYLKQNMQTKTTSKLVDNAIILPSDKDNMPVRFTVTKRNETENIKNNNVEISRIINFKAGNLDIWDDDEKTPSSFKKAIEESQLVLFDRTGVRVNDYVLKAEFYGEKKDELNKRYSLKMEGNDLEGFTLSLSSKVKEKEKVQETIVDFDTIYEDDETLELGKTKVKTEGVKGKTVKKTPYYYILENEKEVVLETKEDEATTTEIQKKVDKVILRGTKVKKTPEVKNEKPNLEVKDAKIKQGENLDLKSLITRADDKEDGPMLNDKVVIDKGLFDNTKVGKYEITFKLTNKKGLTTTKKATVTVEKSEDKKDIEFISGENQTIKLNSNEQLSFRLNADVKDFVDAYVDGKVVDKSMYDLKTGSTIVEFKKEFVDELTTGKHEFKFEFKQGFAKTNVFVEKEEIKNPKNKVKKQKLPKTNIYSFSSLSLVLSFVSMAYSLKRK